ncbi:MAG: NADH-quinone oxidoreductase subunit N [Chitinophagaceae bacterium]
MNLIIFAAIAGVVMMIGGLFVKEKRTVSGLALVCMIALLLFNSLELCTSVPVFHIDLNGMLGFTNLGLLINEVLLLSGTIYFILQGRDIEKVGDNVPDYYALIFFVFCGVGIATSFQSLLMLFLGIEIISIPLYILTASDKLNMKSNEAGLKYFLMGAFSTGLMLMGIALVYGATGSFYLNDVVNSKAIPAAGVLPTAESLVDTYRLIGGLILLMISMSFKVSAAPFHFWTPDVYDGAPTPFTAFMATIVKVAAFIAFIKLFEGTHDKLMGKYQMLIAIIITATLLIGNITAVFQQSVKRMLAYSSIAQAGFMMFALFSFNAMAKEAIVLYAAAYCFATIGIFSILNRMDDYSFDGYNGLAKREPLLALLNTIFFLSLAGIPLTAGFFAKYYMVAAALENNAGFLWMFVIAMLCAAISVYYYFRVIQAMYFKTGDGQKIEASPVFRYVLVGVAILIIILGIQPGLLLQHLYF